MKIEERAVEGVTILDLKGKMLIGEGDELLREKINSLVEKGTEKIVLNLEDVPYVDSAGLGEIVRCYTTVSRKNGELDPARTESSSFCISPSGFTICSRSRNFSRSSTRMTRSLRPSIASNSEALDLQGTATRRKRKEAIAPAHLRPAAIGLKNP